MTNCNVEAGVKHRESKSKH